MRAAIGWFVMVSLGVLGCSSVPDAELPGDEHNAARSLYLLKCLKCHQHYDPRRYDAQTWQSWMDKMADKANLRTEEYHILRNYLEQMRREAAVTSASTSREPATIGVQ